MPCHDHCETISCVSRQRPMLAVLLLSAIGAALPLAACAKQPAAEGLTERADHAYKFERYEEAEGYYGQVVDRYPGDWESQYKLGLTQLRLDRPAEARRSLEVALTRRPKDERIADALAEAIYRTGDENDLYTFLRGRAQERQTVHAHMRFARYAIDLGDPDSATLAVDTAIQIDNGATADPYLLAARIARDIGELDLAVRRLRQAYFIEPEREETREQLIALGEVPGPTVGLPPGR